uniref:Integrase catalytic domain-containing protein n=1 Tax=Fagus sylvatica TaxID=28930 RepID=A0A2N9IZW0_FAGSY
MEAHSTNSPNSPAQSPLLLLNHMSNLMSAKLDSTNYMIWKVQITAILDAYSMLDHIDGSIPQPREFLISESGVPSVNPAFPRMEEERQSFSLLCSTPLYPHLSLPWLWGRILLKKYGTLLKNDLHLQPDQMYSTSSLNCSQSRKEEMSQSLPFFRGSRLSEINSLQLEYHSDHEELIHVILKGLPKEYAPFASAIRTRDGVLSLEKLSVLLQTEEQSLNETSDSLSNSALAMFVSQNKPSNGFNGNQSYHRGRGRNNYTRGRGGRSSNFNHNSNFTPSHPPQPQQSQVSQFTSQGRTERPTCQICWKIGHYAIDCYHRMDFAYQGKNPTTKLAAMASASNLHHNQNTETWLTDSGASDHITASANNLNPQVPYQGQEQVSVGNGQNLPIQHIGYTYGEAALQGPDQLHQKNGILWHSRLCHPSAQLSFSVSNKRVTAPFALVHSDLWGPAPVQSSTGFKYYLVLVDEFTKFTWVYLLKHKSDTLQVFTDFHAMIQTQFSLPLQVLRTDCGGEFTSNKFNQFCATKGIVHQVSCPHTPQQNGVAERKHRHLIQCALALLSESNLPMSHWHYAVSTAAHVINRLPTPNLSSKSPWEVLFHTSPDLTHLRAFGCQCFPLLTPYTAHKLYPKTTPCVFLGYPTNSKGLMPPYQHFTAAPDVPHSSPTSPSHINPDTPISSSPNITSSPSTLVHSSAAPSVPNPVSNIPIVPIPPPIHSMQTRSKNGIFKPKLGYIAKVDYSTTEPNSYTIASKHPQWCTAMDEEFQALHKQGTWSLVSLPPHKNVVGCKWVYKLKYNSDGTIARYKARLVAKGFHQQYGVDFDETFSPVIKPPTVRLVLSLAVSLNWPLRQLDVKNAFLHGALKEEAPRAWFESFTSQLLHLGFSASTADSSLFIYKNDNIIAYLLLYVDDIVLTSNTPSFLDHLIAQLSKIFDLKDLGQLHYFLGLQVTRTSAGLHLNQAKYASDLLKKHNMMDSKPAKTPSCPNTRLSLHEGDPLPDPHAYRSLVGALHYLTFTRPDISFSIHQVCQYMSAPTTIHFAAAKRILRYLRGTLFHGIAFHPGPLTLSAYTDADWAGDPDDRRSTSGYLVYLGSNPITWSAKKQPTVSRSSTESEYRALAIASAELCWIRALLKDLGIYLSQPPLLWCDNVSALAIASNPVFHARTKHIEVDFHFVRERVLRKDLIVKGDDEDLSALSLHSCSAEATVNNAGISGAIVNEEELWKLSVDQNISNENARKELGDVDSLTEEKVDKVAEGFLEDVKENLIETNSWPVNFSAYLVSKALLNAYTRVLARMYPKIAINAVHPGYVRTDNTHNTGNLTVAEGAKGPVMLALMPEGGPSGLFFDQTTVSTF